MNVATKHGAIHKTVTKSGLREDIFCAKKYPLMKIKVTVMIFTVSKGKRF